MGKVVKLETSQAGRQQKASGSRATQARKPRGRSKTALVLGGGGFTGAVYEIGALRALDLLSVNQTVNQFDIYVGTSAGSFVATLAANGITPEEMMRVINQQVPTPFRDMDLNTLLRPNIKEFAIKGALLPLRSAQVIRQLLPNLGQVSIMDFFVGLAEGLPSGLYSGEGIEQYMRMVLSDPDRTDDFRELSQELYLTATDLDAAERVVFGREGFTDIPISKAVRASTALPMVYTPVEWNGRELFDGGILSATNVDVAVEEGAKLIVVVNPLVPYVNDYSKEIPTVSGSRPLRISDMGFSAVGNQTFKMMAHQRLHGLAKHWKEKYPGVDIVLIEPEADDELMFHTNVMNFTQRLGIASHGFNSVTMRLAREYESHSEVFSRHGIEISPARVNKVVKYFKPERGKTRAWRRILEQTTNTLLRQAEQ